MQNLRPQEFARDNILVDVMKNLYAIDTNTNVCPSIHVIFSLGMLFTMWNTKHFSSIWWRIVELITAISICLATVFLKQHSVIDIFAGTALSIVVWLFVVKNKK
jgi:membrane-associated phospholipid phosphatase